MFPKLHSRRKEDSDRSETDQVKTVDLNFDTDADHQIIVRIFSPADIKSGCNVVAGFDQDSGDGQYFQYDPHSETTICGHLEGTTLDGSWINDGYFTEEGSKDRDWVRQL